MIYVKASKGDTTDTVIRKFSRKIISEGLLLEFKKKEFYQKPSEVKKQKRAEFRRMSKAKKRAKRSRNK